MIPISFTFNGETYEGQPGDTLASALLRNKVLLLGRSFKYHRPRGLLAAGSEEPNALVTVIRDKGRTTPNMRTTEVELYQGLNAISQNHWPSLSSDIGRINDWLSRFFPAGFYYKTFLWPKSFWTKIYEPIIRAAAGLGRAPKAADPDTYASRFAFADILIVGSGPAGLASALKAGEAGAKVLLCDENATFGGSLRRELNGTIDGLPIAKWHENALNRLENMPNVRLLPRTTAFGYYHQNMLGLCQRLTDHLAEIPPDAPRERIWKVRAKRVILAQGALEKPLIFTNNDLPGIMLAASMRHYFNVHGVLAGQSAIIVTCHDAAWETACDMAAAGADVTIADARDTVEPALLARANALNIKTYLGFKPISAHGGKRVGSLTIADHNRKSLTLQADCVGMSGGYTPSLHLFSHTQAKVRWDEATKTFLPGKPTENCAVVGAANGAFPLAMALDEGDHAAVKALAELGFSASEHHCRTEGETSHVGEPAVEAESVKNAPLAKAFIDFQNDVTAKDIRLAVREGMHSIEHIKRYTTNGMASDQGKTSNINGLTVAADALGKPAPAIGLTTFRPPFTPVSFGALTGYNRAPFFDPLRKTPMDAWHEAHGAVFETTGLWRRANFYPQKGETMHEAVMRECRAVREHVGLFDASTLGKIIVKGPDAAEFLNRLYVNDFSKLGVGKCRYGILLGEDGYTRDDGVIARLAPDCFHVTTTSSGAARVLACMEDYLQTEWTDLTCWLTSVTEQFAVIGLSGPKARTILAPLVEGLDISKENMPHMSVADYTIAGVPVRLMRVSFSGEMGFELNVPASHGERIWQMVYAAGEPHGLQPYGLEAMHILRAEKGYIVVGQDADGTTTPDDVGLAWAIGKAKPDFIGKAALTRPDLAAKGRRQLVGLLTINSALVLDEGAQIIAGNNLKTFGKVIGHVTSGYESMALGRSIALALIENGRARMGETVHVTFNHVVYEATITSAVFYDATNERLNA